MIRLCLAGRFVLAAAFIPLLAAQTPGNTGYAAARPIESFGCRADGGTGQVNVSGTKLTSLSGTQFLAAWAGQPIQIGAGAYTIASVESAISLTLTEAPATSGVTGFLQRGRTDNGPCILAALMWSRDAGGVVSCANTAPTPAFYGVRTAQNLFLSRPIQWIGVGANSCWIAWTGDPGATTDMLWLWGVYDGARSNTRRTRIEGIHFSAAADIEAVVKLDQMAFFGFHHNWFDTLGGAHPKHYVLARAAQISDFSDNSWDMGSFVSYFGTNLINIQRPTVQPGCAPGDAADANGCYVTLGRALSAADSAPFPVSSCGFYNYTGNHAFDVLLVDGIVAGGRIAGGEVIRGTCSGTTFTPSRGCSVNGSVRGDQPCRGDEGTSPAPHLAGARAHYGFPIISEATFSSNAPFWGGHDGTGAALVVDGGVFGSSGNKFAGADVMVSVTLGSISFNGFDQFEGEKDLVALYLPANCNSCTATAQPGTSFYNLIDAEGGTLEIHNSTLTGLRIGASVFTETSFVRDSRLNGPITLNAPIDLCGSTLGGYSMVKPCSIRGTLVVDPASHTSNQASAPTIQVRPAPYGTHDSADTASVIELVPGAGAGPTAIQLSPHVFLSGSAADSGVQLCWQLACPSGTVNVDGTRVTWAGGPDFLRAWAGGSILLGGAVYRIETVSTTAPATACNATCTLTLATPAPAGRAVRYSTSFLTVNGSPGTTPVESSGVKLNLPGGTVSCPPGRAIRQLALDAAGRLTGSCN